MTATQPTPTLDEIIAEMITRVGYIEYSRKVKEQQIYVKFHTEPDGYFGDLNIRDEFVRLSQWLREEYGRIARWEY